MAVEGDEKFKKNKNDCRINHWKAKTHKEKYTKAHTTILELSGDKDGYIWIILWSHKDTHTIYINIDALIFSNNG